MSGCLKAASLTAGLTVAVVPPGSLGLCSEGDATLRAVSAQSTGRSNKNSNFFLKLGKEKVQKNGSEKVRSWAAPGRAGR